MSKDNGNEPPYEVGYKRPPKEHQFPKGASPNPGGRPKGSATFAAAFRELADEVALHDKDGNPVTRADFLRRKLLHEAGMGKTGMMKMALQILGAFDPPPVETDEGEVEEVIQVWLDFDEEPLQPVDLTSNDAWAHLAVRGPDDAASGPQLSTDE